MPNLAEIKRQIEVYKHGYVFWTKKEIRALPDILDNGEEVKAITSGMINNSTWLLVCTQRRLIFLNRGMFYGLQQIQIPLDRVQSIDNGFTICFGSITVWDGASAFTIGMILKSSIMPFVKVVQEQMQNLRRQPRVSPEQIDIASQLERLAGLRERGHLTDAEFEEQKRKILAWG